MTSSKPAPLTLMATLRRSAVILRPHAGAVAALAGVSLGGAVLAGAGDPLVTKWLIDSLGRKQFGPFLAVAALAMFLYTLLRLANLFSERRTQRLKNQLCRDTTLKMMEVFYTLPYEEVVCSDRGYFVSRIYDEPLHVSEVVNVSLNLLNAVALLLGALTVCLFLSWKVALVLSFIVPVLRWTATRYSSRIRGVTVEEREQEARLREGIGRAVDGYKTVNIFELQGAVAETVARLLKSLLNVIESRVRYSSTFRGASGILLSYAEMAVMIGAGFEVLAGRLTIGGLFGFVAAYGRVVRGFETVTTLIPNLASLGGVMERLDEFRKGRVPSAPQSGGRSMEVAGAAYSVGGRRILNDFDFCVRVGEKVLVTGPNGSGKTTLMHILTGFLAVEAGETELPGIRRISALLTPFGFIPGTISDNVQYASLPAEKRDQFVDLAGRFGLGGKLEQDPVLLSEGEKRKFQVIMTLLKDADFYIFDEPLSNVDVGSSDLIMSSIISGTSGKALLVIMHGGDRYRGLFDRQVSLSMEPAAGEPTVEAACFNA